MSGNRITEALPCGYQSYAGNVECLENRLRVSAGNSRRDLARDEMSIGVAGNLCSTGVIKR